jgi:hypothetical protein
MPSSTGTEIWPCRMFEPRQERVRLPNNTKQRKQVDNSKTHQPNIDSTWKGPSRAFLDDRSFQSGVALSQVACPAFLFIYLLFYVFRLHLVSWLRSGQEEEASGRVFV